MYTKANRKKKKKVVGKKWREITLVNGVGFACDKIRTPSLKGSFIFHDRYQNILFYIGQKQKGWFKLVWCHLRIVTWNDQPIVMKCDAKAKHSNVRHMFAAGSTQSAQSLR